MPKQHAPVVEPLESRLLMSETASATLDLVSTTGTQAAPVYNYNITLTNTGDTPIGTFWFAWVPGENFLPKVPLSEASPAGWGNAAGTSSTPAVTGAGSSTDGSAIQWVAQSPSAAIAVGQSLSGFTFSSNDSPSALAGQSPSHSSEPVLTSFVYQGAPLTDAGFEFAITESNVTPTPPTPPVTQGAFAATIVKSTLPNTIVAGASAKGVVTLSLANQSGAGAKQAVSLAIYATGDGTIDGSSTLLATISHRVNLVAGRSVTVAVPIKSTPPALAAGAYTLVARATDAAGNTTDSGVGPTVQVAAPFVSLSETFARLNLPASVAAGVKTKAVASLKVSNAGNITSAGSTTISLYLSTSGAVDGSATLIRSLTKSLKIKSGKAIMVSLPLLAIPQVMPGDYHVVVQTTDPDQLMTSANFGSVVTVTAE